MKLAGHTNLDETFQRASRLMMSKYIKNNKGPNTDPCSTLLKNYFQFETSPSTTTRCLLSVSQCSIQLTKPSQIPWAFNLGSNL